MKITDIIRKVLDVIDQADAEEQHPTPIAAGVEINVADPFDDEVRRMKQIAGLLPQTAPAIANAPNEQYADVDAVTTLAGGGPNAPKHPHDIRVKDPSMYPNQQGF
jgi:hypothetical protein